MRADAFADRRARGERPDRCCFRPAHATERQGTERGKGTAGKAGFAQEAAAVETAGPGCKGVSNGAVARGMLVRLISTVSLP